MKSLSNKITEKIKFVASAHHINFFLSISSVVDIKLCLSDLKRAEIINLIFKRHFANIIPGEFDQENNESVEDGKLYLQISRLFPLFQQILCFVRRCREVLKNTIQQLAALYNK